MFLVSTCSSEKELQPITTSEVYLNHHDSVQYMGMQTCQSCHSDKHASFVHTGMGRSFGPAQPWRSDASFGAHALVYDELSDMHYFPWWKDSTLMVTEFRIENGDTTHKRSEAIAYIIGSGNHTNSHLINQKGFVYQAPITFYTQEGKWDLAPGFENGNNSRFERIIGLECLSCHNGYPDHVAGSENQFTSVPFGIDCERCHGPGELHVKAMLAGNTVDTSKEIDYTIVNPANLSRDLQMDLCQRCHLQGVAVLNPGKSFYDFKPGMHLKEVMNIFLPRFEGEENQFIMASQADRLRMSECYINSEMSCITCHNPHVSVKETPIEVFNNNCQSCHQEQLCSVDQASFELADGNCSGCHMPPSSSIDIPHVTITDHYIRKDYSGKAYSLGEESDEFLVSNEMKLACLTDDDPADLTMTRGYLAFYERFHSDPAMLDSAAFYLLSTTSKAIDEKVHLGYLLEDYNSISGIAMNLDTSEISDPWTAYRIGEAYGQMGQQGNSIKFFQRACSLMPLNLRFLDKLGIALYQGKKEDQALIVFNQLVELNPFVSKHWYNLGYYYLMNSDHQKAKYYLKQAIALSPDYQKAWEAMQQLGMASGDSDLYQEATNRITDLSI